MALGMSWQFPANDANEIEGPNDPGIAHFTDRRHENLIRESIQNSLDARAGGLPVKIEFSLLDLHKTAFDAGRLSEILRYAIASPHNDDSGRKQFEKGLQLLSYNQQITTLCIKDSNTTGAQDPPPPPPDPAWQCPE